jgi:hypothetical protein
MFCIQHKIVMVYSAHHISLNCKSAIMAAFHYYSWLRWWSDTLRVTLTRLSLHSSLLVGLAGTDSMVNFKVFYWLFHAISQMCKSIVNLGGLRLYMLKLAIWSHGTRNLICTQSWIKEWSTVQCTWGKALRFMWWVLETSSCPNTDDFMFVSIDHYNVNIDHLCL